MSWVRIEATTMLEGPKFDRIPSAAGWLYLRGLAYSARHLTDGFVPAEQVYRLTNDRRTTVDRAIEWLTAVHPGCDGPLWRRVPGGFLAHDYAAGNPTKASAEELRRAKVEAGRAGGRRSAEVRRQRYGTAQPPRCRSEAGGASKQTSKHGVLRAEAGASKQAPKHLEADLEARGASKQAPKQTSKQTSKQISKQISKHLEAAVEAAASRIVQAGRAGSYSGPEATVEAAASEQRASEQRASKHIEAGASERSEAAASRIVQAERADSYSDPEAAIEAAASENVEAGASENVEAAAEAAAEAAFSRARVLESWTSPTEKTPRGPRTTSPTAPSGTSPTESGPSDPPPPGPPPSWPPVTPSSSPSSSPPSETSGDSLSSEDVLTSRFPSPSGNPPPPEDFILGRFPPAPCAAEDGLLCLPGIEAAPSKEERYAADYAAFLAELNRATGRAFRGDAESRKLYVRRRKDGRSADDLLAAARGVALSPHHMGQNDSGVPYNAPVNVLRSRMLDTLIALGRGEIRPLQAVPRSVREASNLDRAYAALAERLRAEGR